MTHCIFWRARTVDVLIRFDICPFLVSLPPLALVSASSCQRVKKKRNNTRDQKEKRQVPEPRICHRADKNWAGYNLAECMKRRAEWSRRTSKVVRISPPAVPYPTRGSDLPRWTITPTRYFLRGLPPLGTPRVINIPQFVPNFVFPDCVRLAPPSWSTTWDSPTIPSSPLCRRGEHTLARFVLPWRTTVLTLCVHRRNDAQRSVNDLKKQEKNLNIYISRLHKNR